MMQAFLLLLAIVIFFIGVESVRHTTLSPHGRIHFKMFKCECSKKDFEEFLYPNLTCYAKSYRGASTLNGYGMIINPIHRMWVSGHLDYKYGTIYRNVIDVKPQEACGIIKHIKDTKNMLYKVIYDMFKYSMPELVHPCPYEGVIQKYNHTMPVHLLPSLFSSGEYRVLLYFAPTSRAENYCNFTFYTEVKTAILESFG
jgi:hypothetical protein